ncbi:hypothetical protein ACIRRA_45430, partial [Nocardia sp. NPDC101769]|uniref:hypothetical protein n=1 Tax=Nocardia sp. NPDC101769 TaxID=3364333 RepID=UPI00381219FF
MTSFVYIVLGLLVLVLAPLAIFFALLTVYTIFNAIVHRDSRPRHRSGSFGTLGISSDTSHPDIRPHHGGHHHDSSGHQRHCSCDVRALTSRRTAAATCSGCSAGMMCSE